jgi:hypothetical protein
MRPEAVFEGAAENSEGGRTYFVPRPYSFFFSVCPVSSMVKCSEKPD